MTSTYSRILLVCLIIIGIVYTPVFRADQVAQAGPLGTFAGILAGCLKSIVIGAILNFAISFIIGLIFGKVPTFDSASFQQMLKEYIKDPLARCVARGVLDEVVGSMLSVVRKGGRDGNNSASYVRNWRNFRTSGQYRGEDVFRGIVANAPLCDFFKQTLQNNFGITSRAQFSLAGINVRVNNLNPFALRSKCPLPPGFNISQYQQNPSANGGWAAFDRMLLPQGNPEGATLMLLDELATHRSLEEEVDLDETTRDSYLSTRGADGKEPTCLIPGPNGKCVRYADIRSPGSYLKDVVQSQIHQELAWITNVDELRELVVGFIWTRLFNRVKDLGADEQKPTYNNSDTGDQQGDATQWQIIIATPTPTPAATPVGQTPTPLPPGVQSCYTGTPTFDSQLIAAIDSWVNANQALMLDTYTLAPPYRPNNYAISPGSTEDAYMNGVIANLAAQGLRAHIDPNDVHEIEIKRDDVYSESYQILTTGHLVRRPPGAYMATCTPATPF